jgi:simple sugar transport system permease protein
MSVGAATERRQWVSTRLFSARNVGVAGIVLAALGFWLVLPPERIHSVAAPIALGLIAVALGIWAVTREEKRVGWGAVASGVIALVGGFFATRASANNLNQVVDWGLLFSLGLAFATPLVFAAMGGLFSERSGVVNIGLEGMMLMGAYFGIWGTDVTGSWFLGLLIGMLSGGLLALVLAVFSIHLRADQIVTGTALIFLAYGITGYLFNNHYGYAGIPQNVPVIPNVNLKFLSHIPPNSLGSFLYSAFGSMNLMTWIAIALVPLSYLVIFKTPIGLRIRSVGEHPRAADTVGINVYAVRYVCVTISGILAGMGGAYLSIGYSHNFAEKMTSGRGFIALAALIFGNWRPFGAFAACLLFGFSSALAPQFTNVNAWAAYGTLFQALPYVLTLVAVAGVIGRTIPPAADGRPYVKQ